MKLRTTLLTLVLMGLWTLAAVAAGPMATPEGVVTDTQIQTLIEGQKAFGDPTDFKAAALAGAQYLRRMHADITEDNALNGDPDDDLEDAGWDWVTTATMHTTAASSQNLYGVIANNLYKVYLLDPTPEIFTVMQDVADYTLTNGPSVAGQRYAGDMLFLMNFATLPGVVNPAQYQNHAKAIWDWRLANYGDGTAAGFVTLIADGRHGQGYDNGIIAWDPANYVQAVAMLDVVFPGMGYDLDADSMAAVMWEDSFNSNPGYFDVYGACQGNIDDYSNVRYYWYTLGVQGLISAFNAADVYPAERALLEATLLECQYDDGAFSYQYGASATINDRDFQSSGYATMCLGESATQTPANLQALYMGAYWLAYWQDPVGANWQYSDTSHYPEVGSECSAGLALAWNLTGSAITASSTGADPAQCGVEKVVTFNYNPMAGAPGLRGYELTLEVVGPVDAIVEADFADAGLFSGFGSHYFDVVDNGDGTWTVNDAILGSTGGLTSAGDMFSLTLNTNADGLVSVNVLDYKLRDPDNVDMFADVSGTSFAVDCTAPGAVDTFTGEPGHTKSDLDWTMADISDVAGFEIYRGVWYDNDVPFDSAYPEYDDLANDLQPTRPSNRGVADASGEWTLVHTAAPGDVAYTDNETVRGIYYYEIFAFDTAGNYGPPAVDPVQVMNYWLGDVSDGTYGAYNGEVDAADITALGSFFGMSAIGLGHIGNQCDVGPTDDNSRLGVPTTDDNIDFEDLMIFAMNYNVVSAAKGENLPGSMAYLSWTQLEDGRYAVSVVDGNGLKGLRVSGNAAINGVTAGDLVSQQDEMTFMANVGTKLDANVAVMGLDVSFQGEGELLIINAAGSLDLEDLVFEARGSDNSHMDVSFSQPSGSVTPAVYSLNGNYPNPFNPLTKISFSLPEAAAVQLTVYGLDGRKVATLVNDNRDAGNYEVNWMGRDDKGQLVASGTYFYRLDAGTYSQVRKMTLMK